MFKKLHDDMFQLRNLFLDQLQWWTEKEKSLNIFVIHTNSVDEGGEEKMKQ